MTDARYSVQVVGNLFTFYTVNRYGRRFIFNWTLFACTILLLIIGFLAIPTNNQKAKWAIAALVGQPCSCVLCTMRRLVSC